MHATHETEADIRANRIDPVLRNEGWGVVDRAQAHRELICPGRILGGGQRGTALSADDVLSYRSRELAVIEAERAGLGHTASVGQAKDDAARLQTRFAYTNNGIDWYGIDMDTGAVGAMALPFPSPDELWRRCFPDGNDWRERFGAVPLETGSGKQCRRCHQPDRLGREAGVAQITNRDDRVGSTKDRSIQAVGTGHPEVAAVDHGCGIPPAPLPHPERNLSSSCSA